MGANIYHLLSPFMRRFRQKRFDRFKMHLEPGQRDQMLDVGGYPGFWTQYEPVVKSIDCLNIHEVAWEPGQHPAHNIRMQVGNGCDLAFPDQAYDILFSNSVIEHVGGWAEQQAFAREARRVGGGCGFKPRLMKDLWSRITWVFTSIICRRSGSLNWSAGSLFGGGCTGRRRSRWPAR